MSIFGKIKSIFTFKSHNLLPLEEIANFESYLIEADVSISLVERLIKNLEKLKTTDEVVLELKSRMLAMLKPQERLLQITSQTKPFVIFVAGVNGGGKTTTIGKLAYNLTQQGKKVLVGACDTFRAGATIQLEKWTELAKASIEKPTKEGEDPSAVAYRTLKRGIDENFDVVILDTSGRLQSNKGLMDELSKMQSVLKKIDATKPDLTLLVLDGSSGQNAVLQATEFSKYIKLDGVCITKLDSSSKGGILLSIASNLKMGVYFTAFGEQIEDLSPFKAEEFINGILKYDYDNN